MPATNRECLVPHRLGEARHPAAIAIILVGRFAGANRPRSSGLDRVGWFYYIYGIASLLFVRHCLIEVEDHDGAFLAGLGK
jgi:hypothetical protein